MAMCPDCRMARLSADGSCRNCERTKMRVSPSRNMPVDAALRLFVAVTVLANLVVFGARAALYVLSYFAVGDLRNGDLSALDRIHTYSHWATLNWFATILSLFALGRLRRRWTDAVSSHALTRPEIGLRWLRDMPSSKTHQYWQMTQGYGYMATVVLNLIFRHAASDPDKLRAWAVLEVTLCATVITASIGVAVSAQRMTAQLLERVGASEQAARAARVAEPDPIG